MGPRDPGQRHARVRAVHAQLLRAPCHGLEAQQHRVVAALAHAGSPVSANDLAEARPAGEADALLRRAYASVLDAAAARLLRTVAMPALGCGVHK